MITRDYPPKHSGIATHTCELVKAIRNLGVRVDVYAGETDFRTLMFPFFHGIDFQSYDIVHVQSTPYAMFINHPNIVMTVHAPVSVEFKYYPRFVKLKGIGALYCEKRSLKKVKHIIAVSDNTKNDVIKEFGLSPEDITTIHNGVDCERFKPISRKPSDEKRIFMCSRLDKRKNIIDALRVMWSVHNSVHNSEVVEDFQCEIAGVGPEHDMLVKKANELGINVRFLGDVSDEELPKRYAESDIFISTSVSEGFNLTILEAMASGCAVLVSDISPHREFVHHFMNGLLYSGFFGLDYLLRFLFSHPNYVKRFSIEARKTALEFTWDKMAQKTIQVYDKVLSESNLPLIEPYMR